ncbi:2-hydroxychromene-2-carboxylate isomerase [Paraburkholderia bannensis]|uniref:2-hydroxychromene-2-carboxylate isomerase n=1 Tax=Paraburkholderia bannensis TaxID=765414 RepID=UPI0005A5D4EE|nr:2-hydroxychromene-2-carboxylate isomerase [Paraburkholderia bannensis]
MKTVEFYFDFGSPASYLAWTQLPAIAAQSNAQLIYRPILLGGIFKASNNASPAAIPAKGAWMRVDLTRFARRYGVQFEYNPHFPINTLMLMRGATGLQMQDEALFRRYVDVVYRAMWAQPRNMADPATIGEVLSEGGLDAAQLLHLVESPAVKEKLKQDTEAAVARGLFGAPTMFVGDEMFFGQDRLDFVKEALG